MHPVSGFKKIYFCIIPIHGLPFSVGVLPSHHQLSQTDTFIFPTFHSEHMHDIVSSKKMENGIVVFWVERGVKKNDSFNYAELIDMKINAGDLLNQPTSYKIDKEGRKLVPAKK